MSVVLNLPPELETDLAAAAAQRGVSLSDYIADVLSRGRSEATVVSSGADLVAYWTSENLIGTRPEIANPSAHARSLRQRAENRLP